MADENTAIAPLPEAEPAAQAELEIATSAPPVSGSWAPEHLNPELAPAATAATPEPAAEEVVASYVPRTVTRFYKGLSPEAKAEQAKASKASGKAHKNKDGE